MSDAHLRQLERDAAQGDLEAEARLLLERVRVGDLTQERLELAAYYGHEAATLASNGRGPDDLCEWAAGLQRWGGEVVASAAVLLFETLLTLLDEPPCPEVLRSVEAAREWVICPCEQHLNALNATGVPSADAASTPIEFAIGQAAYVPTLSNSPGQAVESLVAAFRDSLRSQPGLPVAHSIRDRITAESSGWLTVRETK